MKEEYKIASFSIEKELLEEFRIEVKKSPFSQKYVLDKYLRIAMNELKAINEEAEWIKKSTDDK